MLLLFLACTGAPDDSADACAQAPVVTWDNFGQALLNEHCQPCHASAAGNRFGAPIEVVFDTHEDATTFKDAILRVATGDAPTMPPAISIGDTDRELLRVWLTCYE
jgi:uncharacterized membrane protein